MSGEVVIQAIEAARAGAVLILDCGRRVAHGDELRGFRVLQVSAVFLDVNLVVWRSPDPENGARPEFVEGWTIIKRRPTGGSLWRSFDP